MKCSIVNCEKKKAYAKTGWCSTHYMRVYTNGSLEPKRILGDDVKRFWSYVNKTNTCWLWTGAKHYKGYGIFLVKGKVKKAHRFSYELHKGKILKGLQIDHVFAKGCTNRACVRPSHLEEVTNRENVIRGKIVQNKKFGLPVGVALIGKKYMAQKYVNGKNYYLGMFTTPKDAHQAYEACGENYATTN